MVLSWLSISEFFAKIAMLLFHGAMVDMVLGEGLPGRVARKDFCAMER